MESKEVMPLEKTYARVDYRGNVNLVKHQFLTVRCQYYILLFPFDIQQCRMPFGSWAYTVEQVEVDAFESRLAQQIFEENSEWEIISFSGKKESVVYESFSPPIVNRTFQEIHYDLVFKRKPNFFIYMIVVPCSIIVHICLLGLFAPFNTNGDRQEKLTLGLTTLLTVAVLLHIVTGEMPKSAEGLPLLGKFILWELVVCATAVAVSVLLMYGHRHMIKCRRVPPDCIRNFDSKRKYDKSTVESYRMEEHLLAELAEKQFHHSDISSDDIHESSINMATIDSCVGDVISVKKQILQIQEDIALQEHWNIAFERIDMVFLLLFLSANAVSTYIIFVYIPGP
uniref:Uncharacterized protein n=1 Tax=Plectus sambesii TaxID=2011161 RepID=A0A914XRD4_9BILA